MDSYWKDKKVAVTGGAGFLGSYVCERLKSGGCDDLIIPRSRDYDLTTEEGVKRFYADNRGLDQVIHLAAVVGGIGANKDHPGSFLYKNLMMGTMMIEHARLNDVSKFVAVGTICAYPKFTPVPFKEDDLWIGYPEETNAPYGLAKKMMLVQSQGYREEYGFNSVYLLPVNLYGPGDNFDLHSSHVIPAIVRKVHEAKKTGEITLWGDGSASREFLYVDDAAEGICLAAEHYDSSLPVNLGNGREVRIKELVEIIADIMDFDGTIVWDTSKPNGQPRRCLDTSRAKKEFNFTAKTSLEDGLRKTIEWYLSEGIDG